MSSPNSKSKTEETVDAREEQPAAPAPTDDGPAEESVEVDAAPKENGNSESAADGEDDANEKDVPEEPKEKPTLKRVSDATDARKDDADEISSPEKKQKLEVDDTSNGGDV